MHHHHALALLIFSIVFAGFALFTLCTFAPKVHASATVNSSPGEAQITALSGIPIRRRSNNNEEEDSTLYVRDGILLNYRGQDPKALIEVGTTPSSPMTLLSSIEDLKAKVYQDCAQHLRFFDPSLPIEPTLASQDQDGILNKLFTAATLFKRDNGTSLTKACSEYYRNNTPSAVKETIFTDSGDGDAQRVGVYLEEVPFKREITAEQEKKLSSQDHKPKENVILTQKEPETFVKGQRARPTESYIATGEQPDGSPAKKAADVTTNNMHVNGQRYNPAGSDGAPTKTHPLHHDPSSKLEKRDASNDDLLGRPMDMRKKRVIIDFKKAERDAHLADLADGFLIETEYLTPGRKVVQHLSQKPNTRTVKLHFEGEKLILDDPARANPFPAQPTDAQGIMDNVLAMHDQQQLESFGNFYPSPGSRTTTVEPPLLSSYNQPTHRRYDLAKRDTGRKSPVRRSFRFDRRA